MGFWIALLVNVVATALSYFFRPRAPKGSPDGRGPESIQFPTNEEGIAIPAVWGTRRLSAPNLLAFTNGGAVGPDANGAYQYFGNFQYGVCLGEIDTVNKVFLNDTEVPNMAIVVGPTTDQLVLGFAPSDYVTAEVANATYGSHGSLAKAIDNAMLTARPGEKWRCGASFEIGADHHRYIWFRVEWAATPTSDYVGYLTPGVYDGPGMATEIARALNAAVAVDITFCEFTCTYSTVTKRFTITMTPSNSYTNASLRPDLSWPDYRDGAKFLFGFDWTVAQEDLSATARTDIISFVSDYAVEKGVFLFGYEGASGILRFNDAATTIENLIGYTSAGDVTVGFTAAGDQQTVTGSVRTETSEYVEFVVNAGSLYGSVGGFTGKIRVYKGTTTQIADETLRSKLGLALPAMSPYRRLCYAVVAGRGPTEDCYLGNSPYAKTIAFEVRRIDAANSLVAVTPEINSDDVNPAVALYDVLTNSFWGCAMPTYAVDAASFRAAAVTLASEGMGLSPLLQGGGDAGDFIGDILRAIDGTVYIDPFEGTLKIALARDDYTTASLFLVDKSNADEVEMTRPSWAEARNSVRVSFKDRTNAYEPGVAEAQDAASIDARGEVVTEDITFEGIMSEAVALIVANRALVALTRPLAQFKIVVNREGWELRPGSVFRLTWAPLGITDLPVRVTQVKDGALDDLKIVVEAVEDAFGKPWSNWTDPTP